MFSEAIEKINWHEIGYLLHKHMLLNKAMVLLLSYFNYFSCDIPDDSYLFKVNNGNTRAMCEFYSKLTIKTPEQDVWCLYF